MISGKVCRHISASGYQETDKLVYQTPKMHRNQDYSMVPIVDILTRARSHIIFQVRIMKDWGRLELPRVSGSTSDAGPGRGFFSPNLNIFFLFIVFAFLRHLGPPRGRGRGRDRAVLLEQGTPGVGPSSPNTPDSHLPRWWGEKWGRMGKMVFCVIWGPRGVVVGVRIAPPF